ncbi:MAG TPA: hypothetical protein VFT53_03965 [Candidatus Saccharimonadales bacterium]|nr:hypothetical protein [Candidatus Saccharimonadales bacterium]
MTRRRFLRNAGCVLKIAGVVGAGAGVVSAVNYVASLRDFSHCENCDAVSTATAAVSQPETVSGKAKPMDVISKSVALRDGSTGWIIAPQGSSGQQIEALHKGDVLFLAVGGNTVQYGRLDGDEPTLENRVTTDSPFYNYSSEGYTGQILTIVIDGDVSTVEAGASCNQPVYCLDPQGSGEPVYRALVLSAADYQTSGAALIEELKADQSLNLGSNPRVSDPPLPASTTKV